MTDSHIATLLKKLPRTQWSMLQAMLDGSYKPKGTLQWRTFDALIRKGLLVIDWDREIGNDNTYHVPAEIRLAMHEHMGHRDE